MPGLETPTFWRHRKRGSDYKRVGAATCKSVVLLDDASAWLYLDGDELCLTDNEHDARNFSCVWPVVVQAATADILYQDEVIFYMPVQPGPISAFVRRTVEFNDGRFVPIDMCQHSRSQAADRCMCPHCVPFTNDERTKTYFQAQDDGFAKQSSG